MTHPGNGLHRIAGRVFSGKTMERLIDPVLADLQIEYARATKHGSVWARRWILVTGYTALLRVVVLYAWRDSMRTALDGIAIERRVLRRAVLWALATTAVVTLALMVPIALRRTALEGRLMFLVLVAPAQLPMALPVGLCAGILLGLSGLRLSRLSQGGVLAIALVFSVASFVTLAWIIPAANQAYRATAVRLAAAGGVRRAPPEPGLMELTLTEHRQRMDADRRIGGPVSSNARASAITYHMRWALPGAPLVLAFFALSLLRRGRGGRFALGVAAFGVFAGYYVLLFAGRAAALTGLLPASAGAWLPNAVVFGISVAVVRLLPQGLSATVDS